MILGDAHSDVWINAKSTTATLIQAEINQQKEDLPLTEQILKEYHQYLDFFFTKTRQNAFLKLDHGTTKLS